jgi:hypothetical protein
LVILCTGFAAYFYVFYFSDFILGSKARNSEIYTKFTTPRKQTTKKKGSIERQKDMPANPSAVKCFVVCIVYRGSQRWSVVGKQQQAGICIGRRRRRKAGMHRQGTVAAGRHRQGTVAAGIVIGRGQRRQAGSVSGRSFNKT